jgi:hypothetical protein
MMHLCGGTFNHTLLHGTRPVFEAQMTLKCLVHLAGGALSVLVLCAVVSPTFHTRSIWATRGKPLT